MKQNKYENELNRIYEEAIIQVQKLADEYREKVLLPICKRAKMRYCVTYLVMVHFSLWH